MSLEAHQELVKNDTDQLPVVIFTREIMDAEIFNPVGIILPLSFVDGPTRKGIPRNIQGDWDP